MSRTQRTIGMIGLGLANGFLLGGVLVAAHRSEFWAASVLLIVGTVVLQLLRGGHLRTH